MNISDFKYRKIRQVQTRRGRMYYLVFAINEPASYLEGSIVLLSCGAFRPIKHIRTRYEGCFNSKRELLVCFRKYYKYLRIHTEN